MVYNMVCGNGICVTGQTGTDWTNGTNLDNLCAQMAAGHMNLMLMNMGSRNSDGTLNLKFSTSQIVSMVNRVHAYNTSHGTNILMLNLVWSTPNENLTNYQARINGNVSFCKATGCDGVCDDVETLASASTASVQISYYNGATTALNAIGKKYACFRSVGNTQSPYSDNTVIPALRVDYFLPMFYNGNTTATYISNYWNTYFSSGYINCPVSIGCGLDTSSLSSIIAALNPHVSPKPAQLVGFNFWALDAGNATWPNSNWTTWNNWAGKNFADCMPASNPILTTVAIPTTTSVIINGSIQMSAVCRDQNNNTMTCPTLTWASSNTSIATVSPSGLVTGIAAGNANITARSGTVTSNTSVITVTTTPPQTGNLLLNPGFETGTSGNPDNWTKKTSDGVLTPFSFTYPEVGINNGKSVAIQRIVAGSTWAYWLQVVNLTTSISSYRLAGSIKTQNVTSTNWGAYMQVDWFSSTGYISTSFSQKIVGTNNWTPVEIVSPPPSGAIRAEIALLLNSTGVGDKVWFDDIYFGDSTSTPTLTTITTSPLTTSLNVGATQQLTATCKDQNANTMTCPTLTWVSSNTSIATVNSSGLVTGIAVGTANITTSVAGKISNPPSGITVTVGKKFTVQDVMSGTTKIGVEATLDNLGTFTKDGACVEVCNRLGQL